MKFNIFYFQFCKNVFRERSEKDMGTPMIRATPGSKDAETPATNGKVRFAEFLTVVFKNHSYFGP